MRRFRARGNGLSLSVVEWESEKPRATCLLLHGFMDAAATFDFVAPAIAAAGVRVVAPDLRGFGESDRVSGGGYYHFPDYLADVDALVREHISDGELYVVGHSMGGTVATLFAGSRPERIAKLAVLEGLGPPDSEHDLSPLRTRKWLEDLERAPKNVAMTEDDAMNRLATAHPRVPRDVLATRLPLLASRDGDGKYTWRFDPLHRTTSPMPFFAKVYASFAARVPCPVLYVTGGPLGWRVPDEDARLAAFAHGRHVDIDEAGHMMHWTKPAELSRALIELFG
jgi:pimeloyl-ACP methyl ester carboxylesterase